MIVAPTSTDNVRNSEADIIQLQDGRLLLGWTEFYAGSGADHAPARLVGRVSGDGGRSWGEKYTVVENDGGCNVMEVNFLRLASGDIALFYVQKNTESTDCRIMICTSTDEGQTFGPAKQLSPDSLYIALTNGRALRLGSGPILLEAGQGGDSYCYISDDDGQSWHVGQRTRPEAGSCWEPACIELEDGSVMMLMRTRLGSQYKSISIDGGESWTRPQPTVLTGTAAPCIVSRVPTTGDILVIWNNNADTPRAEGNRDRPPLPAAISRDEAQTWSNFRDLEAQPDEVDAWAYPAVTWVNDTALVTYFEYSHGHPLKLTALSADWFYG